MRYAAGWLSRRCPRAARIAAGALVLCAGVSMTARPAQAETNPTPIAVPIVNPNDLFNPQPGAPYPSSLDVIARGGPSQQASVYILLHAVTHPCPEDLAVLLVHNGVDKYLLMSHAGSCRALQGTDLMFKAAYAPLPDSDPSTAPHPERVLLGASDYGPDPVFPAPAPAGPYFHAMPDSGTTVQGTWSLYVIDTRPTNRGVIAGGWTFAYDTTVFRTAREAMPIAIPSSGPAAVYPISFDLSDVPLGVNPRPLGLRLNLSHTYPDDLRIVLESPQGTAVVVMANAGGDADLVNTFLEFNDFAPGFVPDSGPTPSASYKTGSVYEEPIASLPSPAPPELYAVRFSAFSGQETRGIWRLWVYDDFPGFGGSVQSAQLVLYDGDMPFFTINAPTTAATYTARQPFLHVAADVADTGSAQNATWRNVVDGTFYSAGAMTFASGSFIEADIPLRKGSNVLTFTMTNHGLYWTPHNLTVTVPEFSYYLSEGATGGFFDEDVTLANPSEVAANVSIDFLPEHSAPVPYLATASPFVPLQLHVNDIVPGDGVSTVVHSTNGVPLAVERTMSWDSRGYGGHAGTAVSPNTRWLFAEGSQGFFDTFLLLANDNPAPVDVAVRFLIEGGGVVNHPVTVPAHARFTIYAGDIPAIVNSSFGIDVSAPAPIIAERSMYFPHGGPRTFEGGHESAGVNATSTRWFLAEGATGPFFECFLLLSNPTTTTAHAALTYLLPSGATVTQSVDVPANGRTTINVEGVDPRLANTPVSTTVLSDVGIIVERSMYWPDISLGWREAHNSFGVTAPALRWCVADGRIGGPRGYQTYILLANPNPAPAEVVVRYLKDGRTDRAVFYTLLPTSRMNVVANDAFGLTDGVVSAEVQVLNFQPIVVEKAMYWNSGDEIFAAGTGVVATPLPPP